MGLIGWIKEFASGKPSEERAERWRREDEAKYRAHTRSANPVRRGEEASGSYGHDDGLEGEVNSAVPLRFEYVDRDGVCTVREVVDWIDTRFYVKGICTSKRVLRTFRKDQIERWLSGQEALMHGTLRFGRSVF